MNTGPDNLIDAAARLLTRAYQKPFLKYLFVGMINTLFGYGVFTGCMLMGINYKLSLFISMVLGTLFNFKSIGTFVFSSKDNRLILKFFAVYLLMYFINVGMLRVAKIFFENLIAVQAFLVLPVAFIAFTLMSKFVFNKRQD